MYICSTDRSSEARQAALAGGEALQKLAVVEAAGPKGRCTRCHGSHGIPVRTRRWDKGTRKLVFDDGVRLTVGAPEDSQ